MYLYLRVGIFLTHDSYLLLVQSHMTWRWYLWSRWRNTSHCRWHLGISNSILLIGIKLMLLIVVNNALTWQVMQPTHLLLFLWSLHIPLLMLLKLLLVIVVAVFLSCLIFIVRQVMRQCCHLNDVSNHFSLTCDLIVDCVAVGMFWISWHDCCYIYPLESSLFLVVLITSVSFDCFLSSWWSCFSICRLIWLLSHACFSFLHLQED